MAKESKSFFWASYADLMTSLFFVMLTLFIVVIIALNNARIDAIEQTAELQAKIDKADEINNATRELDTQHSQYFQYFPEFKKHKLAVTVNFRSGSADMNSLPSSTKEDLRTTGKILQDFIIKTTQSNPHIQYLLIIDPAFGYITSAMPFSAACPAEKTRSASPPKPARAPRPCFMPSVRSLEPTLAA